VQELLKSNAVTCKTKYSESGALLMGKLFDDNGNRMGPSFSSKNGVRYRFYISTALRGRKHEAGSVARIAARDIEGVVEEAVRNNLTSADASDQAYQNGSSVSSSARALSASPSHPMTKPMAHQSKL
jgi:hypothetical protein